ncbi:MAG: CARDB domain-containing protein, partial [Burkholderiales bacterium]
VNTSVLYDAVAGGNIGAGESRARQATFALPFGASGVGALEITVYADATTNGTGSVFEANASGTAEGNNAASITVTSIAGAYADLKIDSFTVPPTARGGDKVTVTWTVTNIGSAPAVGNWIDRVVLSPDSVYGNADDIATISKPRTGPLAAGASYPETAELTLPLNFDGTLYAIVRTDSGLALLEPDTRGNNTSDAKPISVAAPYSDFLVEAVTAPTAALSGTQVEIAWRVRNLGDTTAAGSWQDRVVLSQDGVFGNADDIVLATINRSGPIPPKDTYTVRQSFTIPADLTGSWQVLVRTDVNSLVFEGGRIGNNLGTAPEPLVVSPAPSANLVASSPVAASPALAGSSVSVGWSVTNAGEADAIGPWIDYVYLSLDGQVAGATLLGTRTRTSSLAQRATYDASLSVTLPEWADTDTARLLVVTDAGQKVYESGREADNLASSTLALRHVDLRADKLSAPPTATSGDVVTVSLDLTQAGTGSLSSTWTDRLYLSRDAVLDANDRLLDTRSVTRTLDPGAPYTSDFNVQLPVDASGAWFLIGQTDSGNGIKEVGFEGNNTAVSAINIALRPYADLETTEVVAPPQTIGDPARLTVSWKVANRGTGVGLTTAWTESVIASRDGVLGNGDDIVLGTYANVRALTVGDGYTQSQTVLAPAGLSGRFTLFVRADSGNAVFENDSEANNTSSTAPVDVMPIAYADLQVVSAGTANATQSGGTVAVNWRVENRGIGRTNTTGWSDRVTLARNVDGTDVVATAYFDHFGTLAKDAFYDRVGQVNLPEGLSGTFYVFVETGGAYEFIYDNNNRAQAGTVTVTVAPSADLVVQSITAPAAATEGESIPVTWTVLNKGDANATGAITDTVELFKPADRTVQPINLGAFTYAAGLQAGKVYTRTERVNLPVRIEGGWAVRVTTNVSSQVFELGTRANNNTTVDDQLLLVSTKTRPDLQVKTIDAPPTVTAGSGFAVNYEVVNRGQVGTSGQWSDKVYLSVDNKLSGDDILLDTVDNPQALDALVGIYPSGTKTVSVPTRLQGQAYIIVVADGSDQVDEHPNDFNNSAVRAITINPYPPADLVASNVSAPAQAVYGSEIEVRFKVTNNGVNQTDKPTWVDSVWLARDKTRPTPGLRDEKTGVALGNGGIFLGSAVHTGVLAKGESYDAVIKVRIPAVIESGSYYITPWTDAYDAVLEDTFVANPDDPAEADSNNYKARAIDIIGNPTPPKPDLQVTEVVADATGSVDAPFKVSWTVQNRDDGAADVNWFDSVWVSDLPFDNPNAKKWFLGSVARPKPLGRLDTYTSSLSVDLSPAVKASYVTVVADQDELSLPAVDETNELNNSRSTTTQIIPRPADLVPISMTAKQQNFSGEKTTV